MAERCHAKAKTTGEQCRQFVVPGAPTCHYHGSSAGQVRAAAERKLQLRKLQSDVGELLVELEVEAESRHPVEVLLGVVNRCWATASVLRVLVTELEPAQTASAPLLSEYGVWLDRAARASKLALDAGVEARMVNLAEEMAAFAGAAFDRAVSGVGLSRPQAELLREAYGAQLRALPSGGPDLRVVPDGGEAS